MAVYGRNKRVGQEQVLHLALKYVCTEFQSRRDYKESKTDSHSIRISPGAPGNLTKISSYFLQFLHGNSSIIPLLGHVHFQIHASSCYSATFILYTKTIVE
jgi:hypothetical protein